MKKIILVILSLFLLSGCDVKYELDYKDNTFYETLFVNNYYVNNDESFLIDHYKNDNIYSDINDKVITDKRITSKGGNKYNLEFMASYDEESYSNSLAISSCFEYHKFEEDESTIYSALYGDYYCDEFDKLEITFDTDKKINYSNAHEEKFGNLVWNFEPEDDIEIEFEINKNESKPVTYTLLVVLLIVATILLILYFAYKFYTINKKNKEV